jgi:ATP-binding cassette subfamily B protein
MDRLKKFISYYRYEPWLFALDMFAASCIAVMDLTFPVFTRILTKDLIPNRELRMIVVLTGAMIALYLVRLGFQYVVNYWGHVVGVRMEYRMRKDLFSHLQTLDVEFFDNTKVGYLMSRIVNDLREVSELAHHGPEDLFIATLMLIGSFAYLSTINLQLTVIVFLFVPIIGWFAMSYRKRMYDAFRQERERIAEVNADLENSLSGMRETKSFTNEDYEMSRFDHSNNLFRIAREVAMKRMAEYVSGLDFLTNLLNLAVLCAGAFYVYADRIDYADLMTYLVSIGLFLQPIRRLTAFTQQYQSGMSGFDRFVELMAARPSIVDRPDAKPLTHVKGHIEIREVSFEYEESEAVLHGVSLEIRPGQTVALVGSSGGGKTTLCRLIPRFYDVTSGQILIDGTSVRDIKLEDLRKAIGLVQQDVFLFTGTIKENILYGKPTATDEEVVEAAKNANIHDFIDSLPNKYDTYVGERGVKLSGGQKQRVSIARVFLKNPPILILDEATSSLDTVTERQIQASLARLSEGRTTLVIAHRLSTVQNADLIVVLEEGRIQEMGSHRELLAREGIYAKLYHSQFQQLSEVG